MLGYRCLGASREIPPFFETLHLCFFFCISFGRDFEEMQEI